MADDATQTPILAVSRPSGNAAGILANLGGSAAFVCNDTLIKLLGADLPPGEIMLLRGMVAVTLLTIAAAWSGALRFPMAALRTPAFTWRLIGELGSTFAFVISLMHLKFADASGIQQFQPLAVTAASAIFLAEPVGWRRWLAAFAGLIGVLLIVKPGTGAFEPFAMLALICVAFIVVRDLATRAVPAAAPLLMLALTSAAAVMAGGLLLLPFETWLIPSGRHIAMLTVAAAFLTCGYVFITMSLRIGELSVVVPFRYASVIFAVVIQWLIWGTLPDGLALTGIALVVMAGLYSFHRERVRRRLAA